VAARERLADLNPSVEVVAHATRFTREVGEPLAAGYDVIVDATDNFAARYAVSDVAVRLGVPNVYGAVQRFEGQASVFDATRGPCYRCAFPSPPPAGLAPPCGEVGVLGAVPGVIGTIQATEALKLLLGAGSTLVGRLLLHDALAMTFDVVRLGKDPACLACGPAADPHRLAAIDASCEAGACAPSEPRGEGTIDPAELARRLTAGRAIVVDVREPHEHAAGSIAGARLVPLGELAARATELDRDAPVVVVCRSGARAARAVSTLRGLGFVDVLSLAGGLVAWSRSVDRSLPVP
jgi:adenylyltransferase/sulfurtransferase